MRQNFRENVAEEMIRHIEAGTSPWQKPWEAGHLHEGPINPVTQKSYKGINSFWLEIQGRSDPRWLTYKQAESLGAQVNKGEKATLIEYWKWSEEKPLLDEEGKPQLDDDGKSLKQTVHLDRPKVFYANVFNAEQIDGLEPYKAPPLRFEPIDKAELLLSGSKIPVFHDQNDRAFYSPMKDEIHLPLKEAFPSAYDFYATALHEVGHATGHEIRLNREFGPFGSETYAKEELKAEMASYMISRELGLGHNPDRHAAYIESWAKAIKEDKNFIFQAAKEAETIRSWVMEPEKRLELEKTAQAHFNVISKAPVQETSIEKEAKMNQENHLKKPRVYLAVPFKEKEEAKSIGAKWDKKNKSWYAPDNIPLEKFKKWTAQNPENALKSELSPQQEFAEFLKDNMVELKGLPVMDGEWHRVSIEGEPDKKNAGYKGFLDGRPAGLLQNFKHGEVKKWVAVGQTMTPEQKAEIQANAAKVKEARKSELEAKQTAARKRAFAIWKSNSTWADTNNSEYLKEKQVRGYGIKVDGRGNVIIPLRDEEGFIHSLQTISKDNKLFTENGRKSGLMHIIDPKQDIENTDKIVITEGYSTGATAHEFSGKPTVVAFDSGNLKPVAQAIKNKYPNAEIVIAADNDHTLVNKPPYKNVGLEKAKEAAEAVNGVVVEPFFSKEEKDKGLTDWNDLKVSRGHEKGQADFIKEVIKVAKPAFAHNKNQKMSMAV